MAAGQGRHQATRKTLSVVIRPEAETEIAEAYEYYEAVSEGLGAAFLLAVEACLDGIERSPKMYAAIYKDVRRGLLRRFPYGICYLVEQETIVVLACFHARRDPKQWQQRT